MQKSSFILFIDILILPLLNDVLVMDPIKIQGMRDPISDSQSKVAMLREHFAGIEIKELNAGYYNALSSGNCPFFGVSFNQICSFILFIFCSFIELNAVFFCYIHSNNCPFSAGHCPHDELPEEVNCILREWVATIESKLVLV